MKTLTKFKSFETFALGFFLIYLFNSCQQFQARTIHLLHQHLVGLRDGFKKEQKLQETLGIYY